MVEILWRGKLLAMAMAAATGLGALGCINPPGMGLVPTGEAQVDDWPGPQQARTNAWYYLGMDDTSCANGSSVGLGLSVGENTEELVIYLSGGGACWDVASCTYFKTAANLNMTYGPRQLGTEVYALSEGGFMDRQAEVNPFPEATYAYVPYCTGDLHTGRTMRAYDGVAGGELVHHQGANNIDEYLEVLTAAFPQVERVWLVGISAGGYGVSWNFERFRKAFAEAEMHAYSDASPWLNPGDDRWSMWQKNWGLDMPEGCPRCEDSPTALPAYLADKYPESHFALSVFARDPVLSAYLGVLPGEVEESVNAFVAERFSRPNTSAFVAQGSDHEGLLQLVNDEVQNKNGLSLAEFVSQWTQEAVRQAVY